MELDIYEALTSANVSSEKARAVAESINKEIDRRYELHARQLATRGDISELRQQSAEMEGRLVKAINEAQRWTMGAVFAGMATVAAIVKLL
jgi:multidrug resistance efflux pump